MSLTTDPNDPDLTFGVDHAVAPQAKKYLVLSDAERAKGFVRPYRDAYRHVGKTPVHPLRELTAEERARHAGWGYVRFEAYPPERHPLTGRFWTARELANAGGCGAVTTMGRAIAETYARDPSFYGSTYCTTCQKHLPVGEFTWYEMDGSDGPVLGT